jgi:hypothetical protein
MGLSERVHCNPDDYGRFITIKLTLGYLFSLIYFHQVCRLYRMRLDDEQLRNGFAGVLRQNAPFTRSRKHSDLRKDRNNFGGLRRITWRELTTSRPLGYLV